MWHAVDFSKVYDAADVVVGLDVNVDCQPFAAILLEIKKSEHHMMKNMADSLCVTDFKSERPEVSPFELADHSTVALFLYVKHITNSQQNSIQLPGAIFCQREYV